MIDMKDFLVAVLLVSAVACSTEEPAPMTKAEAALMIGQAYCADVDGESQHSCAWSVAQRLCSERNAGYCAQPVDEQGLDECLSQMQVKTLPRVCYRLF